MSIKSFIVVAALAACIPTGALAACPYDANCLNNPYGAGSPYKADGLNNPYSAYGSPYSKNFGRSRPRWLS